MATVVVNWTTQDMVIANPATFNQYDAQILKQEDNSVVADATVPLGTVEWTFPNVAPGDYLASVSIMDSAGAVGAPPQQSAFTIPTEATAPVPVSVGVTLGA